MTTTTSRNTIVRDQVLEPYYCSRDNHGWTIFEEVESKEDSTYTKAVSHPSSFSGCLKTIAKLKVHNQGDFDSIKSYLETYVEEHNKISSQFNLSI